MAAALVLALLLTVSVIGAQQIDQINLDYLFEVYCFIPCSQWPQYSGQEWIPETNCEKYHNCINGKATSWAQCGSGLRFDPYKNHCEQESTVSCPPLSPKTCPPTLNPTLEPSPFPSAQPSAEPTRFPTPSPTRPPQTIVRDYIRTKRDEIERNVLVSYTNTGVAFSSTRYKFDGLMNGLDVIAVDGFGADFKFNLYEGDQIHWKKGLVSLAAFLANAMVESIQYDSCDENNFEELDGMYAISNSCGQEGYSYQDEECSLEFESSCPVLTTMEVTAVNGPIGFRVPPPLQCKPGTNDAGYWDSTVGQLVQRPFKNSDGRTDTAGCCWWGRGAIQTRGPCSIGKINFFLGKKGADLGRETIYPAIDFCKFPEALCASADERNLRWNSGLFEWAERIQRYNVDGWNYENELNKYIQEGMTNNDFITAVSRIVNRKCHIQGCSELEARMLDRRVRNFDMIVRDIFELPKLLATPNPTPIPTRIPTRSPSPMPNPMTMSPTPVQKTNPNESQQSPPLPLIKDDALVRTDPPTFSDGLLRLEGNAARRTCRVSTFLVTSVVLVYLM